MRVIVSGFEPSWGIKKTPSGELAKLWNAEPMPVQAEVKGIVLPQQFGLCTQMMCDAISEFDPQIILMFGATPKDGPIRLERFGINVESTPMGDNMRIPVQDRPIIRGGPSAYESTIPIDHLISHLDSHGIHAKASYHAGTHTCNSILYGVMHWLSQKPENKAVAGFIHVSYPNEFGVVSDEDWTTSSWPEVVRSSIILIQETIEWYSENGG